MADQAQSSLPQLQAPVELCQDKAGLCHNHVGACLSIRLSQICLMSHFCSNRACDPSVWCELRAGSTALNAAAVPLVHSYLQARFIQEGFQKIALELFLQKVVEPTQKWIEVKLGWASESESGSDSGSGESGSESDGDAGEGGVAHGNSEGGVGVDGEVVGGAELGGGGVQGGDEDRGTGDADLEEECGPIEEKVGHGVSGEGGEDQAGLMWRGWGRWNDGTWEGP